MVFMTIGTSNTDTSDVEYNDDLLAYLKHMREKSFGFFYNGDTNKPIYKDFIIHALACCKRTDEGCLLWQGSCSTGGYPQIGVRYKKNKYGNVSVARLLYQNRYGAFNKKERLHKKCYKPKCVNPDCYIAKK